VFYLGTFGEKEVVVLSNVPLQSYLIPPDFAPGAHSIRVEAMPRVVSIYSGNFDAAVLLWGVYNLGADILANAAAMNEPIITSQGNGDYRIDEKDNGDIAYIHKTLPVPDPDGVLVSMVADIESLDGGEVSFWVTDADGDTKGEKSFGSTGGHYTLELKQDGSELKFYIDGDYLDPKFTIPSYASSDVWNFGDPSNSITKATIRITDLKAGGAAEPNAIPTESKSGRTVSLEIPDNTKIWNISIKGNNLVFNLSDIGNRIINGSIISLASPVPIAGGASLSVSDVSVRQEPYEGRDMSKADPEDNPLRQSFTFTKSGDIVIINAPP
jgi:hypothetical protein